jgi:GH18 family chitinase
MKFVVLTILLSVGLHAQWITGHYAAQNGSLSVSNIPWSKYTHIVHFAAAPNSDGTVNPYYLVQAEINSLISSRPAGKKVVVCIKDNDSNNAAFAQATAPGTIATFVGNIVNFVNTNGYDGVDIDWEANVNVTQYQDLLTRLRNALPSKLIAIDSGNWNNLETVAGTSHSKLDQINIMCYDMDYGNGYSWHNDALMQNGNPNVMTCDWRVRAFTNAGVPKNKIGIGLPFYGRRWTGVTLPLVNGTFSASAIFYRDLVTDSTRWQPQYQVYDSGYKANYLSIPGLLNEFISYNGTQSIADAVAWQKAEGFGGFMTFTLDYEYLTGQTGDARHPLSTALYSAVFGGGGGAPTNPGPTLSSGSPTGTLGASTTFTTLSVVTNVNASCRYATAAGTPYSAMPSSFSVTGGTTHSATVTGLQSGTSYTYYARCSDPFGNVNTTDYAIAFSTAAQPTSTAPNPFLVTPNSGAGDSRTFTFQVSDGDGYATIQQIDAVFDTSVAKTNSCVVEYWAPSQTLFLKSDDNATWSQAALGSSTILRNSQCSLNPAASSASGAGSTLDLKLAMTFAPAYAGTKNIFVIAADQTGLSSAWQTLGTWTVPTPPPAQPLTLQLTPVNGVGFGATFVLNLADTGGYGVVQQADLFIGPSLGATNSCFIDYWAPSRTVSLRSNDNVTWKQGALGNSTVLENAFCAIGLASATVSGSGNTLTLSLPIMFKSRFVGTKLIYTFAADQLGRNTGWQNPGNWTVR